MVRVSQYPAVPDKKPVVETTATIAQQRAFLADLDRQLAVLDAKKLDKNANYEK